MTTNLKYNARNKRANNNQVFEKILQNVHRIIVSTHDVVFYDQFLNVIRTTPLPVGYGDYINIELPYEYGLEKYQSKTAAKGQEIDVEA